jgi:tRNA(Ile)-lysidine synthase
MGLDQCVCDVVRRALRQRRPQHKAAIALAVSGGADSMALLHAAARAVRGQPCPWDCTLSGSMQPINVALFAITVDHGIRPDSKEEAAAVLSACRALDIPARAVTLGLRAGAPGLMATARRERYRALHRVSVEHCVGELWTAHQHGAPLGTCHDPT